VRGASKIKADRESPFNHPQKFALENVEFCGGYSTDFGVYAVPAERVAESFRGNCNGCDDEAVAGE